MKIDKIKTLTFKFQDDNGFYIVINGKRAVGELEMPLDESKKIARSLCRISMQTYAYIDAVLQTEDEK